MPQAQLKDYYKILNLSPDATEQEVKRAFRVLAKKYHPDAGGRDELPDDKFMEAQEAYGILSDGARRKKYDEERWLAGMTKRVEEQEAVTPMWILKEAIRMNSHMDTVDVYRMNHLALQNYIFHLLDDDNMQALQENEEQEVNNSIVKVLLEATRGLKYAYMLPVAERLERIADDNTVPVITYAIKGRKRQAMWEKRLPYVIALITMVIVVSMYFWAAKK